MGPRRAMKLPKYPPELRKPHVASEPQVIGLGGWLDEYNLARQRDDDVMRKRFVLLAEFHGAMKAGEVDFALLATNLATAHVPGLTLAYGEHRGRGRPRSTDDPYDLYRDVLNVVRSSGSSVANACRILTKRSGKWRGRDPKSLASRFHENQTGPQLFSD